MQTLHIAELPRHEPPAAQDGHLGSTLLQPQKSSSLGVLLYETWAHMGLRWAFVESLESSKI